MKYENTQVLQKKLRECERRLIELKSSKESQNPAQERRLIENYARDIKELQKELNYRLEK